MPIFKGNITQFIAQNMRYPAAAFSKGVQGRVVVTFCVEPDCSVTDPKVVIGVDKDLDAEALRLIQLTSGQWTPAMDNGKAVRCKYNMPVTFRLS